MLRAGLWVLAAPWKSSLRGNETDKTPRFSDEFRLVTSAAASKSEFHDGLPIE